MIMISCAQEGEDYGKGVIFYLRENKVTIGTIIIKINYKSIDFDKILGGGSASVERV